MQTLHAGSATRAHYFRPIWGIFHLLVFFCVTHPTIDALAQPLVSFTWPTNGQQLVTFSNLTGTVDSETGTIQQVTFEIYN
jgi:hypothetical protein